MAITISGENNNDKILAQDGVIDQISGINIVGLITSSHINVGSNIQLGNAGIITATTFVGNLTGNVNSTSPLLLQTGGSERFRITGNNELGIAGANYGSSGQVLTSGGSGSAVSWTTPVTINNNADNRVITGTGSANVLNAESNVHVDGSGRLLVGTSTNNAHANADNAVISGTGNIGLSIMSTDSGRSSIYFGDSSSSPGSYAGFIDFIHSSNSFNIGRGNDNSLTIDSSGRLLLGTTTEGAGAADRLTIASSATAGMTIRSGTSSEGNIYFSDGTSGLDEYRGIVRYDHSDNSMSFRTNATERLRIEADGGVNIGAGSGNQSTLAPLLQLHKASSAATAFLHITNTDSGITNNDGLVIGYNGSNDALFFNKESTPIRFATAGIEVLRIDPSGRLLVNNSSSTSPDGFNSLIQVNSGNHEGSITIGRHTANSNGPALLFQKSRSGSATPGNGVLSDNDTLGVIRFYGSDGTDRNSFAANIGCEVDGTPGGNDMPGRLIFSTTADGASTSTERLRIDSSGNVLSSGNTQLIGSLTSDGNDDKAIMINGGGAVSDSRGGYLLVHGNEHSSNPGITRLHAGNVGTAFIAFNTAGSERMRIASTGPHIFVGGTTSVNEITETSSSSGLVIGNTSMGNGGLAIINSTTGTGRIYFGDSVGGNAGRNQGQINYYHNGNYMLFATAGSERMRIASNGAISSTITSPDPFNTIQTNLQLTNGAGNSGAGSRINFACGSSQAHIQSQVTGGNSTNGTALVFATSDSASAGTARVRIETDGRLSFATEANAAGAPDAVIDIGSHSNKATIRFKGCDNKSGMMLHKRIHNGAAASSNAVTLLTVNQWQSPNSHIFGVVTVMGVSPTSAFGFQVRGYFFAERGSSNTNLTNTQVGTMAVIEGTGTGGNPQGTLSWSGQNLQYNTPAVAYVDMHVNVEYHAYDGATVTLNVDKATH